MVGCINFEKLKESSLYWGYGNIKVPNTHPNVMGQERTVTSFSGLCIIYTPCVLGCH
jgi:hypothetical protein